MAAVRSPRKAPLIRQLAGDRRLALIEAAIRSLKRHGHEGLSVRRIAAEAGVSIGLINHHFPNKNALIAEAYRHFNQQLIAGLTLAVERAPTSARARLRAFFEASFSPPNLDPDVLAVWVVFWGLYRHSKEIQNVHRETYCGYVDLVRGMLTDLAKEAGKSRVSLRLAAIGLTAMLDGLWLEWCLDPEDFRPKEAIALCEVWVEQLCKDG
jgi:TetR/AcrR family transcriptional regulator, transcriptional repressor of bet genes